MSRSNKTGGKNVQTIIKDDRGWADFFITRIGLILFAAVLLLAAFKVYPVFQEQETKAYLDAIASDIASKIEAVDSTTIPRYRYVYVFDGINENVKIEISTEYVVTRGNLSKGERELFHAEPIVIHVYPPNSNWSNASGLREYLSSEIGNGSNGDISSRLNFSMKKKVDSMFDATRDEIARNPFRPDLSKPLIIEKLIIYYNNQKDIEERDYVLIYQ